MSWQGQVNQPIGVAGIDSNGKIHALDASQLYNLNASNISSGSIAVARLPNGGVNGASQLVQLDSSGNLPTLDASSLTNLSAANISGSIPTSNLNKATTSAFGVVQIGSNIDVSAGIISVPAATTSALGVVQPDGVTITIVGGLLVSSVTANLSGGSAGSIPYQTSANTTTMLATGSGVLVGGATPSYTTTPTLTGTNFSGIPNSATTATSANTASAIVARDSSGDFTAHNVTVTGSFIGNASNYNAYDPTIVTGSSTLTTSISMIIATGTGGYITSLPDPATFPVWQLGKPIYYINNAAASNTVQNGNSYFSFLVTGATTTPPLYALSSTTLPTVTNMTIAGNVATATANNASAQTFDYVTTNNILQVTPKMTFTNGNVLSIDSTSTTGSTKFNYVINNLVQIGSKVQVDVGGTVNEITVAAGSQATTGVTTSGNLCPFVFSNEEIRILNTGNNKFVKTNTSFSYLTMTTATVPSALFFSGYIHGLIVYLGGVYYLGGADGIYKTADFEIYTKIYTPSFGSSQTSVVIHNGVLFGFVRNTASASTQCTVINTIDGTTFNTISNPTFTVSPSTTGADIIYDLVSVSGELLACFENGVGRSLDDGITWTFNRADSSGGGSAGFVGINKIGSTYVVACNNRNLGGTSALMKSIDFATWTSTVTGITFNTLGNITLNNTGTSVFCQRLSTGSLYASTDGTTWTNPTVPTATGYNINQDTGFLVRNSVSPNLSYSANDGVTWSTINLNATAAYQFTMTAPSIAVPSWAGIGGQTEQYSVSATSTPLFTAATSPTYTRSTNDITITYAAVTPSAYTHLQLKALTMNSGDVLKQIGADLHIDSGGIAITIPAGGKYALIPTSTAGWQSFQFAG